MHEFPSISSHWFRMLWPRTEILSQGSHWENLLLWHVTYKWISKKLYFPHIKQWKLKCWKSDLYFSPHCFVLRKYRSLWEIHPLWTYVYQQSRFPTNSGRQYGSLNFYGYHIMASYNSLLVLKWVNAFLDYIVNIIFFCKAGRVFNVIK